MENATKALLIAAAVLVAILIISLGLVIYNQAAETIGNINMSENEVKAFNDKYTRYEGTNVKGTKVNALINEVFSNNMEYRDDESKQITLTVDNPAINVEGQSTQSPGKVPTGNNYTVVLTYSDVTKLVTTITVTQN